MLLCWYAHVADLDTIFGVPIYNLSCTNNGIQASASYLAFHVEGVKLGALGEGRRTRKDMSIVCAHGDQILAVLGEETVPTFECKVSAGEHVLLDSLKPHSTAANIIAAASLGNAYVVAVERKASVISLAGHEDKGQSMDWSDDSKLLAISADKGRQAYVFGYTSGNGTRIAM